MPKISANSIALSVFHVPDGDKKRFYVQYKKFQNENVGANWAQIYILT